jgi:RHH-type proline utilization regulon transcriptional repressor/proline dehydrogenase/delta 1-pyrroline-5-carboxylate dehydrogenase
VLFEGHRDARCDVSRALAARTGAIVSLHTVTASAHSAGEDYDLQRLVEECVVTTNTAAVGGNASLMAIG